MKRLHSAGAISQEQLGDDSEESLGNISDERL